MAYALLITYRQLYPAGTAGYSKSEVTLGEVDTNYVFFKRFEANKQLCLYFIGKVLDVTGYLGSFNFQWVWGRVLPVAYRYNR